MKIQSYESIRPKWQIIRAVSQQQHQCEDPNAINEPSRNPVVLQICIWLLVYFVVEKHQSRCVDVIQSLQLRVVYAETMQETDRVHPPRDVLIQEQRRDDEQTREVVYVERFEANPVTPINRPLYRNIVDVVDPRKEEKDSGKVISPQLFVEVRIDQAGDEGDDKRKDEDDIPVDPNSVREVVMVHPVDVQYFHLSYNQQLHSQIKLSSISKLILLPLQPNPNSKKTWRKQRGGELRDKIKASSQLRLQQLFLFGIIMLKKENWPPIKQGAFYQLNLNKNSGPFLSKDIMGNNPISNNLLTSKQKNQQFKKMSQTLSTVQSMPKLQTVTESKTENFSAAIKFCDDQLHKCKQISAELDFQQKKYRLEIEKLYEKISGMNNSLLESSMPVLKNLMKRVKEVNQADKGEYYKIQKEVQTIEMEKRSLEHMILSSKMRIQQLEKLFGVHHPEQDMDVDIKPLNFFE